MNITSLFVVHERSNAALVLRVRGLLSDLRRSSPVFSSGCGCSLPLAPISTRDFEDALVFHLKERWRALGQSRAEFAIAPSGDNLDDVLDGIASIDRPDTEAVCRTLLEEIQRSLTSFSRQCTVHGIRAEAI